MVTFKVLWGLGGGGVCFVLFFCFSLQHFKQYFEDDSSSICLVCEKVTALLAKFPASVYWKSHSGAHRSAALISFYFFLFSLTF